MTLQIILFDPHYLIFDVGVALNRYEEYNEDYTQYRVRRELVIGFLLGSLHFNWFFLKPLPDGGLEDI